MEEYQQRLNRPQTLDTLLVLNYLRRKQMPKRVRLGLLVSELVQDLGVRAEPNKVRELIEEIASTYQDPEEVINWYYEDNNQLMGIESRV